jgi:serine protease Do
VRTVRHSPSVRRTRGPRLAGTVRPLLVVAALLGCCASGSALPRLDPGTLVRLSTSVLKVEAIRLRGGYSLGSGVVVGADRVATNCHVTRDAREIAVLQGGRRMPVQSQDVDAYHDLCMLHVPGIDGERAVRFGPPDGLTVGQSVIGVGHTAGALHSSVGKVLALHRMDGGRVIQSSNYFNSGASGGGLFDGEFRLVGILSFRLRGGALHYFAVPTEWLARPLQDEQRLNAEGRPARGPLAFWEQPLDVQPLFLRAAVLENEGDWRALQPLAADWTRHDASDPEPWYLLGLALARQGVPGEARRALECALAISPDLESARIELERIAPRPSEPSDAAASPAPCHP